MKKNFVFSAGRLALLVVALMTGPALCAEPATATGRDGKPIELKGERKLRVFRLSSAEFEDVEILAAEFLSPEGTLRHVKGQNSLVVIDYPANLANIAKVVEALEGTDPKANVRIEVAFDETMQGSAKGWDVDPGWPIVVEDGKVKNNQVDVRVERRTVEGGGRTRQQILTRDGGEARIWVGQTVQEPMWVYRYGRRHAWWQSDFAEYDFGASLWVRPRILNDGLIEVSVYPRITSRSGPRLSIDVKELTVTILARDGQTVSIGGLDEQKREAYSKILGRGTVFNGTTLSITLTPHIEKMASPPYPGNE